MRLRRGSAAARQMRLRRPDAGFRARATGRRRVAGPSSCTTSRPGRAAQSGSVACSGAAVRPLDGTSVCRARSRRRPVASTCQPHQGWSGLIRDLSAAQTGVGVTALPLVIERVPLNWWSVLAPSTTGPNSPIALAFHARRAGLLCRHSIKISHMEPCHRSSLLRENERVR